MAEFTGLTWDHPRGYEALAEAARRVNAGRQTPLLHWKIQPLEGFESASIADLAARHDLLVLDHPHIGQAIADSCLIPLDDLFSADQIATWNKNSIGPSMHSYRWEGKHWALPFDVAMQTMVRRPDRIPSAPNSLHELYEVARSMPVAQSLAGPHAFLTLISIAGGWGQRPMGDDLLPDDVAVHALEIMHQLYALRPKGSEALNPIELSQVMVTSNDIALVPLMFNYVTYAAPDYQPQPLAFSDSLRDPGGYGGVIGGTGIGFSARSRPNPELLAHIAWLMLPGTQTRFVPRFGGQPSARAAWQDETVNADWGDFYRSTTATAENALLRPRFDGYIGFQSAAAAHIRYALGCAENEQTTLTKLRELWLNARARARGILEDNTGYQKND